jgi:ParB family transcriptional regulator, chromosome partitioning protein
MTTTPTKPRGRSRASVPEVEAPASSSTALDAITGSRPVVDLPIADLNPHPSNPRKDLGDLTELADSIRAHGVRQNLLVVPDPDNPAAYRLVIGHRRTAAARLAGLTHLPAAIDPNLTPVDQLELMLLENLQRTDLSPVEEADGYQGLLDLGVDAASIASRNGRSETTVRSRLRLVPLPAVAREAVHTHAATLEDAAKLTQFEDDPDVLSSLAAKLGTRDFDFAVKDESYRRTARTAFAPLVEALVSAGAAPVSDDNPLPTDYSARVQLVELHVSQIDGDEPVTSPYYRVNGAGVLNLAGSLPTGCWYDVGSRLCVWRPLNDEELADRQERDARAREHEEAREARRAQDERDREEREARSARVAEVARVSADLRADFIRSVLARKKWTAPHLTALVAYAGARIAATAWDGDSVAASPSQLLAYLGVDEAEVIAQAEADELDVDAALEQAVSAALRDADPTALLFASLASEVEPISAYSWRWPATGSWYSLLERLGYAPSTAERDALPDGDA